MIKLIKRQNENSTEVLNGDSEVFKDTAFEGVEFSMTIQFGTTATIEAQIEKSMNQKEIENYDLLSDAKKRAIEIRDANISRIVDWEGFVDENENELECNYENKVELYEQEAFNDIFNAIREFVNSKTKPMVDRSEVISEAVGNSPSFTHGSIAQDLEKMETVTI